MTKDNNTETYAEGAEARIYELAFHFVPTLSEDEVAVQFSHLKSTIEKKGGQFIAEESPRMIDLAYEISKTVKAVKKRYTSAYFGWVKFEIDPEVLADIEKEAKASDIILRYLLISTVRENTVYTEPKESTRREGSEEAGDSKDEKVIDEAQVDKSIDELVQE